MEQEEVYYSVITQVKMYIFLCYICVCNIDHHAFFALKQGKQSGARSDSTSVGHYTTSVFAMHGLYIALYRKDVYMVLGMFTYSGKDLRDRPIFNSRSDY